jgi:hypothetical protein
MGGKGEGGRGKGEGEIVGRCFNECYGNGKTNVTQLTRLRSEAAPFPVAPMMPLLPALEDMMA